MSSLSSPTLAKIFSFWWFQSTSYGTGRLVGRGENILEIAYPNDGRVATIHRGGFNRDITFGIRIQVPGGDGERSRENSSFKLRTKGRQSYPQTLQGCGPS